MLETTVAVLGLMTAVMVAAWAFALARDNGGWIDVFWTFGSGLALGGAALAGLGPDAGLRPWLVAAVAALWALRLGSYIARRVATGAEDPRYARFRAEFGLAYRPRMLLVALPQALATALLTPSVFMAAHTAGPLGARDVAGLALALAAIAGAGLADGQMKRFKADPANRGGVCDVGLWAWSRHPNYFFEWLGWLAYPVIGLQLDRPVTWLSLSASALMYLLLTWVSGVPPLEAAMLRSRGDAYRAYQARVGPFFPVPPKGQDR